MNRMLLLASAATIGAMLPAAPVFAREVAVSVDARSGPWLNKANRKMRYGQGDEAPPASVTGFMNDVGAKLEIVVAADATTRAGTGETGPQGFADEPVDDTKGPGGKYYPSLYTPKILYPANRHALIGAFVDGKGGLMGRPFAIGEGVRVTVPDGAAALNLGFNDISFAQNSGALPVTVVIPDE